MSSNVSAASSQAHLTKANPPSRRSSLAHRSLSEGTKSDGIRSRVVTQVKTKLRKSSRKGKEREKESLQHRAENTLAAPISTAEASTSLSSAEVRTQSRLSEWVATDRLANEASSEIASSEYSRQEEVPRRFSLDGAISHTVQYNSIGTLDKSAAVSRLSSIFSPTPPGTKTTARTSVFDSPSRQIMPSYEPTNIVKDCPSYTFRAALSVACDSDNLHFAAEKEDVWASIELSGEVVNNNENGIFNVGTGAPSLAVAIVIDNS